jgi:hypothetical protein
MCFSRTVTWLHKFTPAQKESKLTSNQTWNIPRSFVSERNPSRHNRFIPSADSLRITGPCVVWDRSTAAGVWFRWTDICRYENEFLCCLFFQLWSLNLINIIYGNKGLHHRNITPSAVPSSFLSVTLIVGSNIRLQLFSKFVSPLRTLWWETSITIHRIRNYGLESTMSNLVIFLNVLQL